MCFVAFERKRKKMFSAKKYNLRNSINSGKKVSKSHSKSKTEKMSTLFVPASTSTPAASGATGALSAPQRNGYGGGGGAQVQSASCLELAIEGERLCRSGETARGVQYLEAALTAGTDDLRTLSAIYSQLGNAYFYMHDYLKALEYHRHDLTLARYFIKAFFSNFQISRVQKHQ